jgi:hypothetical protein
VDGLSRAAQNPRITPSAKAAVASGFFHWEQVPAINEGRATIGTGRKTVAVRNNQQHHAAK